MNTPSLSTHSDRFTKKNTQLESWVSKIKVRNTRKVRRPGGDIPSICQGVHKYLNFRIHGNTYNCLFFCVSQLVSSQQASSQSLKKCWQWAIILCVSLRTIFFSLFVSLPAFVVNFHKKPKCVCSQTVYSLIKAQVNIGKLSSIVRFFQFSVTEGTAHVCSLYSGNVWGMRFHHYRPAAMMKIKSNDIKGLTNSSMLWKVWNIIKIINSSEIFYFNFFPLISFFSHWLWERLNLAIIFYSLIDFYFCWLLPCCCSLSSVPYRR